MCFFHGQRKRIISLIIEMLEIFDIFRICGIRNVYGQLHGLFWNYFLSVNWYYMEISMYPFNLSNNDWYCFVCVKENCMEIFMDLFGVALSYWDRKYCWQVIFSQKFIDFLMAQLTICEIYLQLFVQVGIILECRSPPITGNVDATLVIFLLLSNRLTENDKMFWNKLK